MNIKSWIILGLLPFYSFFFYQNQIIKDPGNAQYLQMGINLEYKGLFIEGFYQNTFYSTNKDLSFCPDNDIYSFNIGYRKDYAEIGYRHVCSHPVIPYVFKYKDIKIFQEGAWDEIYIKLSLEGKLF